MEFDVAVEVFSDAPEGLVFRKVITILQFLKKTVEPTRHELRMKKPSDLVSTAENAPKPAAKEVLHIEADASSKWAALCKDYNSIHVSAIATKLLGFPGKVAPGNQVATSMIESIAAGGKAKTRDLWLDSDRASFMEVEFKRPMVVPLSLHVETADVASKRHLKETDKALEVVYNQIEDWVIEARLDDNVRQAAKTHYKRVTM